MNNKKKIENGGYTPLRRNDNFGYQPSSTEKRGYQPRNTQSIKPVTPPRGTNARDSNK